MLMSESLEIAEMFREAMTARFGADKIDDHYRSFDTICSATQERQDAVIDLLNREALDLMVVVGGYNSSNTCNLARICADRVPTFHIAEPDCLVSADRIRHRPVPGTGAASGAGAGAGGASKGHVAEIESTGWLPPTGRLRVGLTAGASTPNSIIGTVVERLERFSNSE
jgi:4-hydroxy-3-methylbut-2-enyl diphosphate reductase